MRSLIFFLAFNLLAILAFGQQSKLEEKLTLYAKKNKSGCLFVHFDKNVYSNNETIWFTAYLIREGQNPLAKSTVISTSLVRKIDSAVVLEDKFVMQNGIAFGSMILPDSILAGDYYIQAFTNALTNGKPDVVFKQTVLIKTSLDPMFKADLKLMSNGKNKQAILSVLSKESRFLAKPADISYSYGLETKKSKTDASGQLIIDLPKPRLNIPLKLQVKVAYGKDTSFLSLPIPQDKVLAQVKFYPEGGNIINGIYNNIGLEIKDQQNSPIAVNALLYKNEKLIDTIEVGIYGISKFRLFYEQNGSYHIKLLNANLVDSIYKLPKSLDQGVSIYLPKAVARDSLSLTLQANNIKNLTLKLHNFKNIFINQPIKLTANQIKLKIALDDIPKGLAALTICDSLDRPLAERIFFAHYNNAEELTLKTDQDSYGKREKVKLKISAQNNQSFVSVACVQENRLKTAIMNDIESFYYLKNELVDLPIHAKGLPYKDQDYLEHILLVKGWRKYTWQDMATVNDRDSIKKTDSLRLIGVVTKSKKQLVKPIEVGAYGDAKIRIENTDDEGIFDLSNPVFIAEKGMKMYLFVNEKNRIPYQIKVNDGFVSMCKAMAKDGFQENLPMSSALVNNTDVVLKNNERAIKLKEVVITNKKDELHGLRGSNACGDYVCKFNILNCPNHINDFGNTQPIPGRTYRINGFNSVYFECKPMINEAFVKYNGIHYSKVFYVDANPDPLEPVYFSTIYWNQGVLITPEKETILEFYTGDITGSFKIVAQGITGTDVTYSEQYFSVGDKQKTVN